MQFLGDKYIFGGFKMYVILPVSVKHKVSVGQIDFWSLGQISAIEKFWQISFFNAVDTVVIKPCTVARN